jgi:uncharacterized protein YqgQ
MDDDDIQEYVRPWQGLTEDERKEIWMSEVKDKKDFLWVAFVIQAIKNTEQKLKEKNA